MSDANAAQERHSAVSFVVAVPQFPEPISQRLAEIRAAHDPLSEQIPPHFTFIFGIGDADRRDIAAEVERLAGGLAPIAFEARFAAVRSDVVRNEFYMSMIPERGMTAMLALHARLNSGWFRRFLRRDIDFHPHMTLARDANAERLDALAENLNASGFSVSGTIDRLDVVALAAGTITRVASVRLGES